MNDELNRSAIDKYIEGMIKYTYRQWMKTHRDFDKGRYVQTLCFAREMGYYTNDQFIDVMRGLND